MPVLQRPEGGQALQDGRKASSGCGQGPVQRRRSGIKLYRPWNLIDDVVTLSGLIILGVLLHIEPSNGLIRAIVGGVVQAVFS